MSNLADEEARGDWLAERGYDDRYADYDPRDWADERTKEQVRADAEDAHAQLMVLRDRERRAGWDVP